MVGKGEEVALMAIAVGVAGVAVDGVVGRMGAHEGCRSSE